jgi:uncharacterized damage-inducible protein DinB
LFYVDRRVRLNLPSPEIDHLRLADRRQTRSNFGFFLFRRGARTARVSVLAESPGQSKIQAKGSATLTMTKDDIQLLYEYDRWANNRVLQKVSELSDEQFTRDLGGGFRCVQETLLHIIGGEWGWLAYWKEPSPSPAFLTDLRTRRNALFNPDAFSNVAAVQLKWAEVEKEQVEFVNRVTNESLEKMLPFRKTQIRLAHLMQHLANHSTYHRGQVALMMRQLDAEPLATDFHVFLVER